MSSAGVWARQPAVTPLLRRYLYPSPPGVLLLAKGDMGRALDHFQTALEENPHNIPALLGKANVLYRRRQYEDTLHIYAGILERNPDCPPAVRLGLGLCYYQLRNYTKARRWCGRGSVSAGVHASPLLVSRMCFF